jgi:ABC-type sugar transport system permease subunit
MHKHKLLPYFLLLPTIIVLLAFLIAPIFSAIEMSFQDIYFGVVRGFAGLANYRVLFAQERFYKNVVYTLKYLGGVMGIALPLAYLAAILVSSKLRGTVIFRTIYLLPWIMAPVVTAVMFKSMLDPTCGPITVLLEKITGNSYYFFTNPTLAMLTIILHSAWRSFPVLMLFIAAGIATIPVDVYEAAALDGAGPWKKFTSITLPLTIPQVLTAMVLITAWTIPDVEGPNALTGGGPGISTEVLALRLFKDAFVYYNLSPAAVTGVILIIIGVVMVIAYLMILRRGGRR